MTAADTPPLGVYVHWPYCARICPYCDFNVVRARNRAPEAAALAQAILDDVKAHAERLGPRRLVSIFFGGGTPSLMAPDVAAAIIELCRDVWSAAPGLEVTLEANPTDAERSRFAAFAAAGVNRLSLGVQSLDDAALRFLGRDHDAAAAVRAVRLGRSLFPRLSVDLIYALPDQTAPAWTAALRRVVDLGPDHLSPYQLTIEPGTAFHRAARRGALVPLAEDAAADLYETTQAVLGDAGFEAYEVSNHARRPSDRSRHNLVYWRGEDYIGVGPGAHGRLTLSGSRHATLAPARPADYIAAIRSHAGPAREILSARDIAIERLLMGLRTSEGVAMSDLGSILADAARLESLKGLVETAQGRLFATAPGRALLDHVIARLVADFEPPSLPI